MDNIVHIIRNTSTTFVATVTSITFDTNAAIQHHANLSTLGLESDVTATTTTTSYTIPTNSTVSFNLGYTATGSAVNNHTYASTMTVVVTQNMIPTTLKVLNYVPVGAAAPVGTTNINYTGGGPIGIFIGELGGAYYAPTVPTLAWNFEPPKVRTYEIDVAQFGKDVKVPGNLIGMLSGGIELTVQDEVDSWVGQAYKDSLTPDTQVLAQQSLKDEIRLLLDRNPALAADLSNQPAYQQNLQTLAESYSQYRSATYQLQPSAGSINNNTDPAQAAIAAALAAQNINISTSLSAFIPQIDTARINDFAESARKSLIDFVAGATGLLSNLSILPSSTKQNIDVNVTVSEKVLSNDFLQIVAYDTKGYYSPDQQQRAQTELTARYNGTSSQVFPDAGDTTQTPTFSFSYLNQVANQVTTQVVTQAESLISSDTAKSLLNTAIESVTAAKSFVTKSVDSLLNNGSSLGMVDTPAAEEYTALSLSVVGAGGEPAGLDRGSLRPDEYIGGGASGDAGGSVNVNAYMPGTSKLAGQMQAGDALVLLSTDRQGTVAGVVISNSTSEQKLLTLVSKSGIRLTCSDNTPLTLEDGSYINSTEALGKKLPVEDQNGFRWELIVEVLDAGRGNVATIYCKDQCYAAGDEQGRWIWTHNTNVIKFGGTGNLEQLTEYII